MISTTKGAISIILLLSLLARSATAKYWRGLSEANENGLHDQKAHVTDVGEKEPAVFYGRVWYDDNANSKIDKGEKGVEGVKVRLYRYRKTSDGEKTYVKVKSRSVESDGSFEIPLNAIIDDSQYYLKFIHDKADYKFAPMIKGGDSDVTNDRGNSKRQTVEYGKSYEVNAGLVAENAPDSVVFYGRVWYDDNANSKIDQGEEGVEGVKVRLFRYRKAPDGETTYVEVKSRIAESDGSFEIPLNAIIENSQYYLKFSHGKADYEFAPMIKGGDSAVINKRGNSKKQTVEYGKSYQVNAGLVAKESQETCEPIVIDFDYAANGVALSAGTYVKDEWRVHGLTLSAEGGVGELPRLFDTANPGKSGDLDLGAPNKRCQGGGPGVGKGGEPGEPGENCRPLGNVLIIQEQNDDPEISDDNAGGGKITFDFSEDRGQYVYEIGLLDIDTETTLVVLHETEDGDSEEKGIIVPALGDNSEQTVPINVANVKRVQVITGGSGAVTSFKFCPKATPVIDRLIIVAPGNGEVKEVLEDGGTLNLSLLGPDIAIVAETYAQDVPPVLRFELDGSSNSQTVTSPPYALSGDSNGILNAWSDPIGTHELRIFVGDSDNPLRTVRFTVTDDVPNGCRPQDSFLVFAGHDEVISMMKGKVNINWSPAFVYDIRKEWMVWCGDYIFDVFVTEGEFAPNVLMDSSIPDLIDMTETERRIDHYETHNMTAVIHDLVPGKNYSVLVTARTNAGIYSFNRSPATVEVATTDPELNPNFTRLVNLPYPGDLYAIAPNEAPNVEILDDKIIFRNDIPSEAIDLKRNDLLFTLGSDGSWVFGQVIEPLHESIILDEFELTYVSAGLENIFNELDLSADLANSYDSVDADDLQPEEEAEVDYAFGNADENVLKHLCMAAFPGKGSVDCYQKNGVLVNGRYLGWGLPKFVKAVGRGIKKAATATVDAIVEGGKAVGEAIVDVGEKVGDAVGDFFEDAWQKTKDIWDGVKNLFLRGKIQYTKTFLDFDKGVAVNKNSLDIGVNADVSVKVQLKVKLSWKTLIKRASVKLYGGLGSQAYIRALKGTEQVTSDPLEIYRKPYLKIIPVFGIPVPFNTLLTVEAYVDAALTVESQILAAMSVGWDYEFLFSFDVNRKPKFESSAEVSRRDLFPVDPSFEARLNAVANIGVVLNVETIVLLVFEVDLATDLEFGTEIEIGTNLDSLLLADPFYILDKFDVFFFIGVYADVGLTTRGIQTLVDYVGDEVNSALEVVSDISSKFEIPPLDELFDDVLSEELSQIKEIALAVEAVLNNLEAMLHDAMQVVEDELNDLKAKATAGFDVLAVSVETSKEKFLQAIQDKIRTGLEETDTAIAELINVDELLQLVKLPEAIDVAVKTIYRVDDVADGLIASARDVVDDAIVTSISPVLKKLDRLLIDIDTYLLADVQEAFGTAFEAAIEILEDEQDAINNVDVFVDRLKTEYFKAFKGELSKILAETGVGVDQFLHLISVTQQNLDEAVDEVIAEVNTIDALIIVLRQKVANVADALSPLVDSARSAMHSLLDGLQLVENAIVDRVIGNLVDLNEVDNDINSFIMSFKAQFNDAVLGELRILFQVTDLAVEELLDIVALPTKVLDEAIDAALKVYSVDDIIESIFLYLENSRRWALQAALGIAYHTLEAAVESVNDIVAIAKNFAEPFIATIVALRDRKIDPGLGFDLWKKKVTLFALPTITMVPATPTVCQKGTEDAVVLTITTSIENRGDALLKNRISGGEWIGNFDGNYNTKDSSPWLLDDDRDDPNSITMRLPEGFIDPGDVTSYDIPREGLIYLRATPYFPPLKHAMFVKGKLSDMFECDSGISCTDFDEPGRTCRAIAPDAPSVGLSRRILDISVAAAHLSVLAYKYDPPVHRRRTQIRQTTWHRWYQKDTIYDIYGNLTFYSQDPDRVVLSKYQDRCYVAVRGTIPLTEFLVDPNTGPDWLQNLDTRHTTIYMDNDQSTGEFCDVRKGFAEFLDAGFFPDLQSDLLKCVSSCQDPDDCVVFAGHSQGGASAAVLSILFHSLKPTVVSFGAPAGIATGCGLIPSDRFYRYVNYLSGQKHDSGFDPVTFLVPALGDFVQYGHYILLGPDRNAGKYLGLDDDRTGVDSPTFLPRLRDRLLGIVAHTMEEGEGEDWSYESRIVSLQKSATESFLVSLSGFSDKVKCITTESNYYGELCRSGSCLDSGVCAIGQPSKRKLAMLPSGTED